MAISIGESANVRLNFDDIEKSGKALAGLEQSLKNIVLEVNKVTQGFADGNWGEVFLGLISGAGTSLLGIVAIKAAFDGLATIIPVIVSGLGGIVTSLSGFIVPIALATAAIAALVAGIMYLWQTNETFRNGVIQAWEAIKTTMETVVATIVTFVSEKLAQIKAFWDEHGAAVMQAVTNIFNGIKSIIEPVMNGILAIMQFVWPFIVSLIQMVWGNIQGVISGALNIIMGLVKAFAGLFTGDFSLMWEGIKQLFSGALEAIWNVVQLLLFGRLLKIASSLFTGLMGVFSKMWGAISNLFLTALNGIRSFFSTIFTPIQNVVMTVMGFIRNAISTGLTTASNVVQTVLTAIRTVFLTVFNAVRNVVTTAISFVQNFISTGISAARTAVTSALNAIKTTFTTIFNAVRSSVTTAMTNIKTAISNGIQSAWQAVLNFVGRFREAGKNIVNSIAEGITSAIGAVKNAISNVAGKIRDFLPFSPAKEGPLQDIHRLNFGGPIKDSIYRDVPKIEHAFEKALTLPSLHDIGSSLGRGLARLDSNVQARELQGLSANPSSNMTIEVPVHLEGKQIAKVTAPFMDVELGRRGQMAQRARGHY
ncbi:hypothetical protein CAY60_012500 [Shouchella clausii]|uniref:Phage-related protein n=2 Tax=Shouchella TaxID=2893057 RepID=Q5WJJ4_SHOC1|nr:MULTISPECIES: hypothetical protein [Shouchella]MCM3311851.1 hypothetical protein [Psychrobacillus sp. MER TA 17]ALA51902.1 Phage tail length tape-measure protein [Shouchella clausii]MBU3232071.1 hypothetical protein [Shouchella clausii]MBU3264361.1 hypothetical protein [Shouchella clausii]MBU3508760.1 hypothetical protein [Shouchella clausii]